MSWDALPPEILTLFLYYLNGSDIFACQEVCRQLYASAQTAKKRRIFSHRITGELDKYIAKLVGTDEPCAHCKGTQHKPLAASFLHSTCGLLMGSFPLWCIERPVRRSRGLIQWMPNDLDYIIPRSLVAQSGLSDFSLVDEDTWLWEGSQESEFRSEIEFYHEVFPGSRSGCLSILCQAAWTAVVQFLFVSVEVNGTHWQEEVLKRDLPNWISSQQQETFRSCSAETS